MLVAAVCAILDRDLQTLAREVAAYPDDTAVWTVPEGAVNSAGTLVLHLTGNIQHFLGARLAGSGFVRDRPAEFSARGVPRAALLRQIEAARHAVHAVAETVTDESLPGDYPEVVGGMRVAAGEYLIHLVSHFGYHLGQVDYHRRLVSRDPRGVDAIRTSELSTARPVAD
ncbi:MAG TPA: DinB family protein [Gemmatimonadales bacterium]|jgi:uncharacterized damage-inducible protein DinB|nr:DinB family protein [Gemmatimonadales bacterium]